VDDHYAENRPRDSDAGYEQELRENRKHAEIRDAQNPAHVHRSLKKSLFALEAVPTNGAGGVHREPAREHLTLQAHRASLFDDRA
jgi:hypothetical protein